MAKAPAISLVTPVWNGLPYLRECVDSVLAQDFQDWEMIVGDNCSDDGTTEYLQSLKDPRIKVFRHEKNLGVYRNINFVIDNASAPIFMGLCADDYLYPGALQKIVNEWATLSQDVGMITFNWKSRQIKHNSLTQFAYSALPPTLSGVKSDTAFFLFGCFPGNFSEVSGKVALFRGKQYLYDIKYSADHELYMRLATTAGIYLSNTDVVYIRRHDRVAATYIITKGEYHEESIQIYEGIINNLSSQGDRETLVNFYNIEIVSFHLRAAIKSALKGRFEALKSFLKQESPIFWPKGTQLIGLLPFALSERLRYKVSIPLARKILNTRNVQG